jgi:hypothetical protein
MPGGARSTCAPWALWPIAVGAGLLLVSLSGSGFWETFFRHPLRSASGAPLPQETTDGIRLLMIMIPITGAAWLLTGALLGRVRALGATPTTDPESGKGRGGRVLMVLAVIAIAFILRAPLMGQSLWYDEIVAFWYYGQYGPGPIIGNMFTPANHQLQSLGSWAAVSFAGGSLDEWVIRFPALVAGLLAGWPLYSIGRRFFGPSGGVVAMLLLLFMPIAVAEGAEARGYAFMLLFAAASSATLLAVLDDRRLELLPFYAILCTLGIWSHLVTAVVPIGHALVLVGLVACSGTHRRTALAGLGGIALAAITTLMVLAPVLPDLIAGQQGLAATTIDQPTLLGDEGRSILLGLGGVWPMGRFGLASAIPGFMLMVIGGFLTLREPRARLMILVVGAPIMIGILLVAVLGTWVYARFFVFGLPFVALAITATFLSFQGVRGLKLVPIMILCFGWTLALLNLWEIPRQPIRELVERIPDDGTLVASTGIPDMPIVIGWYLEDAANRVIDAGPHVDDADLRLERSDVGWLLHAYPSRNERWTDDGESDLESVMLPGWIDHMDGALLLERADGP